MRSLDRRYSPETLVDTLDAYGAVLQDARDGTATVSDLRDAVPDTIFVDLVAVDRLDDPYDTGAYTNPDRDLTIDGGEAVDYYLGIEDAASEALEGDGLTALLRHGGDALADAGHERLDDIPSEDALDETEEAGWNRFHRYLATKPLPPLTIPSAAMIGGGLLTGNQVLVDAGWITFGTGVWSGWPAKHYARGRVERLDEERASFRADRFEDTLGDYTLSVSASGPMDMLYEILDGDYVVEDGAVTRRVPASVAEG